MVTIEVDEAVWRHLTTAKNPGDSHNDVLRRELGLDADTNAEPDTEPATLDAAIASWQPPGEVDPAHARAALRDAVAWLAQHEGRATKREIVAGARGDHPLGARSWWERAVQPGLRALAAVEYRPGYHDYTLEKANED